jgi:6-pyruvoyltetrahydropterin/6-carboxytetrahydropterin synthase
MERLLLKGKDVGFKFSAAHLLPGHFKCSRMHGHNYVLDVEIESNSLTNGMILDFIEVKKVIRELLEEYDHKLLLPGRSNNMVIEDDERYVKVTYNLDPESLDEQTGITIYPNEANPTDFDNKEYKIPIMDVKIIPEIDFTTAEELVRHFRYKILEKFKDRNIENIYVTLYEDEGQGVGTL